MQEIESNRGGSAGQFGHNVHQAATHQLPQHHRAMLRLSLHKQTPTQHRSTNNISRIHNTPAVTLQVRQDGPIALAHKRNLSLNKNIKDVIKSNFFVRTFNDYLAYQRSLYVQAPPPTANATAIPLQTPPSPPPHPRPALIRRGMNHSSSRSPICSTSSTCIHARTYTHIHTRFGKFPLFFHWRRLISSAHTTCSCT